MKSESVNKLFYIPSKRVHPVDTFFKKKISSHLAWFFSS